MSAGDASTYRCGPTIVWVKDAGQTLLIEEAGNHSWILQGEEAAIWDWLTLNHPAERIVRFLSVLLGASADEAGKALSAILQRWEKAGIVQTPEGDSRG